MRPLSGPDTTDSFRISCRTLGPGTCLKAGLVCCRPSCVTGYSPATTTSVFVETLVKTLLFFATRQQKLKRPSPCIHIGYRPAPQSSQKVCELPPLSDKVNVTMFGNRNAAYCLGVASALCCVLTLVQGEVETGRRSSDVIPGSRRSVPETFGRLSFLKRINLGADHILFERGSVSL
jgi:hypothetical protein